MDGDTLRSESCLKLVGHKGAVNACAVFPNGRSILTASEDGTAMVWDAATGKVLFVLSGQSGPVRTCAVFLDGLRLLTGGVGGSAYVWNACDGQQILHLQRDSGEIFSCAVFPDNLRVVTLSSDCIATIWDASTGASMCEFQGPEDPRDRRQAFGYRRSGDVEAKPVGAGHHSCAVSPNGKAVLLVGGDDGDFAVAVWNPLTGELVSEVEGRCCFACAAGRHIIYAAEEWTVHEAVVYDPATDEPLCTFRGHSQYINGCAIFPDGELILTVGDDGAARVWRPICCSAESTCDTDHGENRDDASPEEVFNFTDGDSPMRSCAVFPDGKHIVVASDDGIARVWEVQTG